MEPADIDWKRIESRFVPDELYEHINAPKWLDLAAPDTISIDDEAWFCRADCKHPKTAEDFIRVAAMHSPKGRLLRSSSERLPFGERKNINRDANNLKRRAAGAASNFPSSPHKSMAVLSKNLREDFENQDPNMSTPQRNMGPVGSQKVAKEIKEKIKSSAQKKPLEEAEEVQLQQKPQPRLKSTMSARNLFSGKDILSQISEFYHDLKKMATGRVKSPIKEETKAKKVQEVANVDTAERNLLTPKKDGGSVKKSNKMAVRVEIGNNSLKEVRACPPTPQRFPSPSSVAVKSLKPYPNARCPLKPPKSSTQERRILQEVGQNKDENAALLALNKDENTELLALKDEDDYKASVPATSEEGNSVFWFLKPCTYLVN